MDRRVAVGSVAASKSGLPCRQHAGDGDDDDDDDAAFKKIKYNRQATLYEQPGGVMQAAC